MSFRFLLIPFLILLAGCGLHPVYSQKPSIAHPGMTVFFKNIEVGDIPNRSGQVLKSSLEDTLNPTSAPAEKIYRLDIKLKRDIMPLIVERDRSITRYSLIYTATLNLVDISTGKSIYSGAVHTSGDYDALNSDYAVYMAEGDTGARVLRDLADEIKNNLTAFFIKYKKQRAEEGTPIS